MRIGKPQGKKKRKRSKLQTEKCHRPTGYKEEYDHIAGKACAIGARTTDLAAMFAVTEQTILNWMRDHPTFFGSIKDGRDYHDTNYVESSLLRRAKGYDKVTVEERLTKDGDVVECKKTTHYPPEVGAAIFWLCNRQPQRWKQISQARFQQLNVYGSGYQGMDAASKLNKKGKLIEGDVIDADSAREIVGALTESGALDTGLGVAGQADAGGADPKAN